MQLPTAEADFETDFETSSLSAVAAHGRRRDDADNNVVDLASVSKRFGDAVALQSLNLRVAASRITVLLGPNGAGKTTAIRMITGALRPDYGSTLVFGLDPGGPDGEQVRRRCGVVSAKPSLYDRLSGYDNLRYAAELYGVAASETDSSIRRSAAQFGIEQALSQRVGGYSTGMISRLALARAVLHDPDLLLLDEPTSGLDPESAQAVLAMVRDMTRSGKSVLMCTHLLAEAEGLADEVVVVDEGLDLETGSQEALTQRYWPHTFVDLDLGPNSTLQPEAIVASMACVIAHETTTSGLRVRIDHAANTSAVVDRLVRAGVSIRAVIPVRPTLEDLYFAIRREHRSSTSNHREPHGH